MKRTRKNQNILSLHVYGILDKEKNKIIKVSLDREDLKFELELDNHSGTLILCDFDIKVKFSL
jgi:hypothetical protein